MDKKKLQKLLETANRSIRILKLIAAGETSQTKIAVEARASTSLVEYYLKAVKVK